MKNIHVIATDKPSRLYLVKDKLKLSPLKFTNDEEVGWLTQNIYITSDEEIKDGDWIIWNNKVVKAINTTYHSSKKIILTTDQDLIKDGVQAIDDKFLEWFVNNPSCEEVEIEEIHLCTQTGLPCGMQCLSEETCNENIGYKIIIPKEEPKQETLEAAKKYANKWYKSSDDLSDFLIGVSRNSFEHGAKYQAERMLKFILDEDNYTEEELESSCIDVQTLVHFIEQFKKK